MNNILSSKNYGRPDIISMFFFKQIGIAIAIMVVLSIIIAFLNKKESYNPYTAVNYVNNPNAFKSRQPIAL